MGEEETVLGSRTEPSRPPDWLPLGYPGNRMKNNQMTTRLEYWSDVIVQEKNEKTSPMVSIQK